MADFDIKAWVQELMDGVGGFKAYFRKEVVVGDRVNAAARFVIRALANPDCEGSDKVLEAIMEARARRATLT